MYLQAVKSLTRLHFSAGSSESLQVAFRDENDFSYFLDQLTYDFEYKIGKRDLLMQLLRL